MQIYKIFSKSKIGYAGLVSYLFLFFLAFYFVFPGYYKIYSYLVSLIGIFSVFYFRKKINFKLMLPVISIFIFVSLADIYNYSFGYTNLSDFEKIIRNVVLIFPFIFFACIAPIKPEHVLLSGVFLFVVTLLFLMLQYNGLYAQNAPQYDANYPGLWFNKGSFSSAVVFFYAFFSGVAFSLKGVSSKILFFVSFVIVSVLMFFTQARGPLLAFVFVNLIVFGIWVNSLGLTNKKNIFLVLIFLLASCSLSYFAFGDRFLRAFDEISVYFTEGSKYTPVGIRIDTWKLAWDVFLENPIWGVGAQGDDAIKLVLVDAGKYPDYLLNYHTHSEYFMTLERGGIIGLLGLFWMMFFPFFSLKRAGVKFHKMYPLLLVVCAFAIIGVTSATIRNNIGANSFIFCLLAGYFYSHKYHSRDLS